MKWRNYHHVELVSADISQILSRVAKENVEFFEVEQRSEIVYRIKIRPGDQDALKRICEKTGSNYRLLRQASPSVILKKTGDRPILIFGLLLVLFLTWLLPRQVLFFQVDGNERIPAAKILEAAKLSGLYFGTKTREVRSEKVKNSLLEQIPQLQWAGINLRGCTAVIQVREREAAPMAEEEAGICHIVAARDGVVSQCTAYRGNLLCAPGQAVSEGQILISGFTDTGLVIRAEQASGEVFAQTIRHLDVILPRQSLSKCHEKGNFRRISVCIGKKRINLWKNSGISSAICDRMYKEYYVTLPGGFQLPISLIVEDFKPFSTSTVLVATDDARMLLENCAQEYLRRIMNAGTIRDSSVQLRLTEQTASLAGEYHCMEMIGKMQRLEIGEKDE